ncbi:peptide MFS transporter [soil metagenome]
MNMVNKSDEPVQVPAQRPRMPKGVSGMAITELWERFSFYGLQGILSFYLLFSLSEGGLQLDKAVAVGIVGAYGGSVYIAQIVGAWLGGRVISPQRMVLYGALVIMAGHLTLAFVHGIVGLGLGLTLIVAGTGALKTNITSIVGFVLDESEAETRDVGFSYFYIAINIGAVTGPLLTGFVQSRYGFHWGFALAAIGMAFAVIHYIRKSPELPQRARLVANPLPYKQLWRIAALVVVAAGVTAAAFASGVVNERNVTTAITVLALIIAAAYFGVILRSKSATAGDKRQIIGYIPLFLAASVYFALLFQKFTAISILIVERIDRSFGGWEFPAAWITLVSPLALVLITPFVARVWLRLGTRQPSTPVKYSIGLIQIGLAYGLLLVVATVTGTGPIPLFLILLVMGIAGTSEVFIGPIGLSLATRIGPETYRSQMVALNFLTIALGSSLSGLLGQYFTVVSNAAYFVTVSGIGLLVGVAVAVNRTSINRLLTS